MNKRDDGGHAFPQDEPVSNELHPKYGTDRGMTLRDYFAAKAMAALLAEPPWGDGTDSMLTSLSPDFRGTVDARFAFAAYKLADAMLQERSK